MNQSDAASPIEAEDVSSFAEHLSSSTRIVALLGAGLSAASRLPTFRGAGGYWRRHSATRLATPEAFERSPGLVWQFYSYRRHSALKAKPNPAHYALARLAETKPEFLALSQNVDGLSQRAGHPPENLQLLHGSLFDIICTGFDCDFVDRNNLTDPIVAALAIPADPSNPNVEADISSVDVELSDPPASELPHCPKCQSLLRPGVVWFGEALPARTLSIVDRWISHSEKIDLMLVVGTSAVVWPAAGYIEEARKKGARVAVINTEQPDQVGSQLQDGDWFFQGDASNILPRILQTAIGPLETPG